MSTRAYIGIKEDNGSVRAIYSHWGGHPTELGYDLLTNFKTKKQIEELLEIDGYISCLYDTYAWEAEDFKKFLCGGEKFQTLSNTSDVLIRLGSDKDIIKTDTIEELFNDVSVDYIYLFNSEISEWDAYERIRILHSYEKITNLKEVCEIEEAEK